MNDLMRVPCGNFIERDKPECLMGRKVPDDCTKHCPYYTAGLSDQERRRALMWADVRMMQNDY